MGYVKYDERQRERIYKYVNENREKINARKRERYKDKQDWYRENQIKSQTKYIQKLKDNGGYAEYKKYMKQKSKDYYQKNKERLSLKKKQKRKALFQEKLNNVKDNEELIKSIKLYMKKYEIADMGDIVFKRDWKAQHLKKQVRTLGLKKTT